MSRPSRAGLPSGPGPRSRSAVRARYDDDQRPRDDSRTRRRYDDDARVLGRNNDDSRARRYDDESQSRQVRPQKSQPVLPVPSSRSRHNPTVSDTGTRSESSTNRSSDSTTSSASSFLDRMKGYASSRTSLEDVEVKPSTRSRPSRAETPPSEPGDGYTLWSRVASAASSLTVSVGKAWASNITTFAGEETPVGQESRLTRTMKAYHLEKAQDPSDLPPWLFDETERRRPAAEPTRSRRHVDERPMSQVEAAPTTRGLRDIYDAAASKSSHAFDRSVRGARSYADDSPQPSKATDRLKALRDAKRSAVNPNVVMAEEPRAERPRVAERDREPEPRRRVGLPSGPRV